MKETKAWWWSSPLRLSSRRRGTQQQAQLQQRSRAVVRLSRSRIVLMAFSLMTLTALVWFHVWATTNSLWHSPSLPNQQPKEDFFWSLSSRDAASQDETSLMRLTHRPATPITVAFAFSLIKCGDFQSSLDGLLDAALVLRHSVHHIMTQSSSHYRYRMYALIHRQAAACASRLEYAGFTVRVYDAPVAPNQIRGDHLRRHIHKEWCCGADEFIKLYAYTLPEPIVVHTDLDVVFLQPLHDLWDVLLYHPTSNVRQAAQRRIAREYPYDKPPNAGGSSRSSNSLRDENAAAAGKASRRNVTTSPAAWPDYPTAFFTRDWGQVMPGRKPGFQAGFLVARTDPRVLHELVAIIKEGNFVDGFQRRNGWGGRGYGGFVGAMAMQGLLAYYYDDEEVRPTSTGVELNQCLYNHMGMDVLYRGPPNFQPKHPKVGHCRNNLDYCENCMRTNVSEIFGIHYTQCRKPWSCIGEGDRSLAPEKRNRRPGQKTRSERLLIAEDSVHLGHCLELQEVWHRVRHDLETKLWELTHDGSLEDGQRGLYKKSIFYGHCQANGQYLPLGDGSNATTLAQLPMLYQGLART